MKRAGGEITVIVDDTRPTWHNIYTSETIPSDCGIQRPEWVVSVQQERPCVVAHNVDNAIILPSLEGVRVVQAGNGRWDNTLRTEAFGSIQPNLLEPGLVE